MERLEGVACVAEIPIIYVAVFRRSVRCPEIAGKSLCDRAVILQYHRSDLGEGLYVLMRGGCVFVTEPHDQPG